MSVFTDIKDLAGDKYQSSSWWRSQLFFYLNGRGVDGIIPGTAVTFKYKATYGEKMRYWDKYPMVYLLGEDSAHFWGANVHYLPPEQRVAGFSPTPPAVTLHKYLRSNVLSPLYGIQNSEWNDIGLIPSEQFVTTINGRNIEIPRSAVF